MGLNAQQYPDSKIYYFVSYEGTFETVATDLNVLFEVEIVERRQRRRRLFCAQSDTGAATIRRRVSLPKGSYNSGKR